MNIVHNMPHNLIDTHTSQVVFIEFIDVVLPQHLCHLVMRKKLLSDGAIEVMGGVDVGKLEVLNYAIKEPVISFCCQLFSCRIRRRSHFVRLLRIRK